MSRLNWIQLLFISAVGYFIFASNSNGRATAANSGNTGAPGENTCGQCHNGGNFGASVSIQVFAEGSIVPTTQFYAGNTYTVRVTVNNTMGSPGGYGFQLTALSGSENTPVAGYSNLASNVKQKTITVQNAFTGRTYLEHNGVTTNNVFQFSWTAPANLADAVTFYAAGNVVNGTGSTSGDAVANTSLTIYPALNVSNDIIQPSCSTNGIGVITLSISGGVPPYAITWQDGSSNMSIQGGPGSYSATITDNAGNSATLPATLFPYIGLEVESVSTDVSCFGLCDGSIALNFISGTPPYQILWNDGSTGGQGLNNICVGIYNAEITDANGCNTTVIDTINEPAPFANDPNLQMVDCHGGLNGWIFHNITGGTEPYTYAWDYDSFNTESSAIYLYAGDYTTTITDANGCVYEQTFSITEPDTLSYAVDFFIEGGLGVGTCEITTTGGTPPYQWNWQHGDTNEDTFIPEMTTSYCVITDANGCAIQTQSFTTTSSVANRMAEVRLYPNPTQNILNIEVFELGQHASLFTGDGQLLDTFVLQQMKTNYSVISLTNGVYYLEIEKNGNRFQFPFLVKH
jgi:hypothetical protein